MTKLAKKPAVKAAKPKKPATSGASKNKTLNFRIAIDQKGLDADGAVSEAVAFDLSVQVSKNKPLDVALVAGRYAQQIMAAIRHFKTRRHGFNMQFAINNQLIANSQMKGAGNLKFTNPVDLAFSIAGLLKAQFDTESGEALLTGNIQHSAEYAMFVDKLGLQQAKQLPSFVGDVVIDAKRKNLKRKYSEMKKAVLENMN